MSLFFNTLTFLLVGAAGYALVRKNSQPLLANLLLFPALSAAAISVSASELRTWVSILLLVAVLCLIIMVTIAIHFELKERSGAIDVLSRNLEELKRSRAKQKEQKLVIDHEPPD